MKNLLRRIAEAENGDTICRIFDDVRLSYGFDHVSFLIVRCLGLNHFPFYLTTYPEVWQRRYIRKRYQEVDPVISLAMTALLPVDWDTLRRDTQAERDFFEDAFSFGIGSRGMTMPTRGPFGQRGLFTVTSNLPVGEWEQLCISCSFEMQLLSLHLHKRVFALADVFRNYNCPALSPREKQCMELIASGKILKQISATLRISDSAVRLYLRSARRKLRAATNHQAVAKASAFELIQI